MCRGELLTALLFKKFADERLQASAAANAISENPTTEQDAHSAVKLESKMSSVPAYHEPTTVDNVSAVLEATCTTKASAKQQEKCITLTVKSENCMDDFVFHLPPSSRLEKVMLEFCKLVSLKLGSVEFFFGLQRISPNTIPADLGMTGGETIFAHRVQNKLSADEPIEHDLSKLKDQVHALEALLEDANTEHRQSELQLLTRNYALENELQKATAKSAEAYSRLREKYEKQSSVLKSTQFREQDLRTQIARANELYLLREADHDLKMAKLRSLLSDETKTIKLKDELEAVKNRESVNIKYTEKLEAALNKAQEQISVTEIKFHGMQETLKKEVIQHDSNLQLLDFKVVQLQDTESLIKELNHTIDLLTSEKQTLTEELAEARKHAESNEFELDRIHCDNSTLGHMHCMLNNELSGKRAEILELEDTIGDYDESERMLENDLLFAREEIEELKSKLADARTELQDVGHSDDIHRSRVDQLKQEKRAALQERDNALKQAKDLRADIVRYRQCQVESYKKYTSTLYSNVSAKSGLHHVEIPGAVIRTHAQQPDQEKNRAHDSASTGKDLLALDYGIKKQAEYKMPLHHAPISWCANAEVNKPMPKAEDHSKEVCVMSREAQYQHEHETVEVKADHERKIAEYKTELADRIATKHGKEVAYLKQQSTAVNEELGTEHGNLITR